MGRFSDRLASLGFSTYNDYLSGEHWLNFRKEYKASGKPKRCAVCNANRYQLHHHNYDNLGKETVEDVTPLCREHHVAVHAWLKTHYMGAVWHTSKAVRALRATIATKKPAKKAKANHWTPTFQGKRTLKLLRSIKKHLEKLGRPEDITLISQRSGKGILSNINNILCDEIRLASCQPSKQRDDANRINQEKYKAAVAFGWRRTVNMRAKQENKRR